jgi:hypothetical protein
VPRLVSRRKDEKAYFFPGYYPRLIRTEDTGHESAATTRETKWNVHRQKLRARSDRLTAERFGATWFENLASFFALVLQTFYLPLLLRPLSFARGLRVLFGDQASIHPETAPLLFWMHGHRKASEQGLMDFMGAPSHQLWKP